MAIAHYNNIKPNELWMAFGIESHYRYIHVPVHQLTTSLDSRMCSIFLHAFRGCAIVLSFWGKGVGNKTACSRTLKLQAHLKAHCSCKMRSVTKPCQPYYGLWYCSMIKQGTKQSPQNWRIYHPIMQHYSSM